MDAFEKEVEDEIKKLGIPKGISITKGGVLGIKGISGNSWNPDIVLEKIFETPIKVDGKASAYLVSIDEKFLAIIECKNIQSTQQPTYRNQMFRAYAELGDLKNIDCPKFVVIPKRMILKRGFNYDSYFKSVWAEIVEWGNTDDRSRFLNKIKTIIFEDK